MTTSLPKQHIRACASCGTSLAGRHGLARYCLECSYDRQRRLAVDNSHRRRHRYEYLHTLATRTLGRFMTRQEAATYLGVSFETIMQMIRDKQIVAVPVDPHCWLVLKPSLPKKP